jgi:hypothetical protein
MFLPLMDVSIQEPQNERRYCCYSFKCTLPSQQLLVRQGHVQMCVLNVVVKFDVQQQQCYVQVKN